MNTGEEGRRDGSDVGGGRIGKPEEVVDEGHDNGPKGIVKRGGGGPTEENSTGLRRLAMGNLDDRAFELNSQRMAVH